MANPVTVVPALATSIMQANSSVLVAPLEAVLCIIQNPLYNIDQGIDSAEALYVDITGPCVIGSSTTVMLAPGEIFISPPNLKNGLWALASTVGHNFAAVLSLGYIAPFKAIPSDFPPVGPTGLLNVIPSYLYQQYTDDDDLQAMVNAQNAYQQLYVDAFNNINLPIYTQPNVIGNLLDWIATGLYGYPRPTLASGIFNYLGPFDTAYFDQIFPNELEKKQRGPISLANDDIYKRALTWHFFKGDGKYFNVRWLKRRIARFIYGTNGVNPFNFFEKTTENQNISTESVGTLTTEDGYVITTEGLYFNSISTNQISVSFGDNNEVTIRFVLNVRSITSAAVCNNSGFYLNNMRPNQINSTFTRLPSLPNMVDFAQAALSGSLELPFQYTFIVQIG